MHKSGLWSIELKILGPLALNVESSANLKCLVGLDGKLQIFKQKRIIEQMCSFLFLPKQIKKLMQKSGFSMIKHNKKTSNGSIGKAPASFGYIVTLSCFGKTFPFQFITFREKTIFGFYFRLHYFVYTRQYWFKWTKYMSTDYNLFYVLVLPDLTCLDKGIYVLPYMYTCRIFSIVLYYSYYYLRIYQSLLLTQHLKDRPVNSSSLISTTGFLGTQIMKTQWVTCFSEICLWQL